MTSPSPTRLPFLQWKDPYEALERPAAQKAAISKESGYVAALMRHVGQVRPAAFQTAFETMQRGLELSVRGVRVRPLLQGGAGVAWAWEGEETWHRAANLDVGEGGELLVATVLTEDVTTTSLEVWRRNGKRPAASWSGPVHGIGQDVALYHGRVYCLEATGQLQFQKLVSFAVHANGTLGTKRVHFEESDVSIQHTLVRGEGHCLMLHGTRGDRQVLYHVAPTGAVQRLGAEGIVFVPIGRVGGLGFAGAEPMWLARHGCLDAPWELCTSGSGSSSGTKSPVDSPAATDGIEFVAASLGLLCSIHRGIRTVWSFKGPTFKTLHRQETVFGTTVWNPWALWHADGPSEMTVWWISPGELPRAMRLLIGGHTEWLQPKRVQTGIGQVKTGLVVSAADGQKVRYGLVMPQGKRPKGLVVTAYGAYGSVTSLSTMRWQPWIRDGWAVGFALVRGGGDWNDAWAAAGRLGGKELGIADFESVCAELQRITRLGAAQTVVFGRSAGGLLVGGVAGRNPMGGVAGMIYAEVPYVDLLKTASDPSLPLTEFEYYEFGNPRAGPAEFEQALRISPVHRLGAQGAPGLRVLCRTGTADTQVFAVESLKWIHALRGPSRAAPDEKYLFVTKKGHFALGAQLIHENAQDLAVFNHWLGKESKA